MIRETPTCRAIIKSIETEPHRWTVGEYRLVRDDGISVWIANGWTHYRTYEPSIGFGLIGRWKFHKTLQYFMAYVVDNSTPKSSNKNLFGGGFRVPKPNDNPPPVPNQPVQPERIL